VIELLVAEDSNMNKVIAIVVALVAAALLVMQQRKVAGLQAQVAKLTADAAAARQEVDRAGQTPKSDPKETERVEQERAELARLRAEVSALRKEKAEWDKKRGAAESAALATATQPAPAPVAPTGAAEGMQWVETILNGPAPVKGTETGNARRKALNGEPLTDAERALLLNMNSKAAELEKAPTEFADFQSAFIGSLLGWQNDPRSEQVKSVINAAMNAAINRGYDYHAPAENADKWDDAQKALNTRATSAIQNVLRPEERAVFDKALIGVLGVDTGTK
jgi:hypothetical protein